MLDKTFVKHYGIYFGGTMLVAFFSYLFYPVLARFMEVSAFGELQSIMALFAQFTLVLTALATAVVHMVASASDKTQLYQKMHALKVVTLSILLPLVALGALAIPFLQSFLHFNSPLPFVPVFAMFALSILALFNNSILQGRKMFLQMNITATIGAVGKVTFALGLVLLGFGVFGAIFGVLLASLTAYIYTVYLVRRLRVKEQITYIKDAAQTFAEKLRSLRSEFSHIALALVTYGGLAVLFTSDILLVKHYFDPHTAGLYAGISAMAKIAYFVLTPISAVLLPSVSAASAKRGPIVRTTALITTAIAVPGVLTTYFFHSTVTALLFGEKYVEMSNVLPHATLAMVAVAIVYIGSVYALALRAKVVGYAASAGGILALALSYVSHSSVIDITHNFLYGAILAGAILLLQYVKENFYNNSDIQRGEEHPFNIQGGTEDF